MMLGHKHSFIQTSFIYALGMGWYVRDRPLPSLTNYYSSTISK